MSEPTDRQPHANLDPASRQGKAEKIERLLGKVGLPARTPLRLLEIGTGGGGIATYFGSHASRAYEVTAVDTVDQRIRTEGYRFLQVSGVELPFPDGSFDVVVSNHVIEHVGDARNQKGHLKEMSRVLSHDGVIYLACPNRWQWVEPHYHLALLSWWPRSWRSFYLALRGKGSFYDCEPLSKRALERLLGAVPLAFRNACPEAMSDVLEHELAGRPVAGILRWMPAWGWRILAGVCPTHVYLLGKQPG
ncbi:class I SAM-dependent methyltransferase [Rhodanobacter sp. DHG33]|uniref:class I SAM-dependent methyltransferase n=1 Tax=Rhodanobacter sp. DHG33 TaxID=2775921 RepID=UPI00177FA301|nr:class I SAM-dependent methyltransferase [Rhodanobacter sp. DHG33]MBD8899294.1 class I SAM-dependent methyltransferase [Rhodanobacter sp. DHG33]